MRLAARLAATLALTLGLASAAAGAALVVRERDQLIAVTDAETQVIARSVQVAVENALRDGQFPDVTELLRSLEVVAGRLDLVVVDVRGELVAASDGASPRPAWEGRALAEAISGRAARLETDDRPRRLVLAVPLESDDGDRLGALVLSRPLDALEADLAETTALVSVASVVFAVTTAGVAGLLLRYGLARPVERLAAATARLADDLDTPLVPPADRTDEIGVLWRGVLELQESLRAARTEAAEEVARREAFERRLHEAGRFVAVGQLAASVAHEIGSPLQVLVGRARMVAERHDVDPSVVRQARLIADQGDRIARIVERMQDLVRRRPFRPSTVDLREEVGKVVALVDGEARRRGVSLSSTMVGGPVVVWADPDHVQQVALNLLLNALQATPAGGSVGVSVQDGDDAVLEVRDTGHGMTPEVLERAFEPLFSTRSEQGGTGLGLAIVRRIVEHHHGRVEVESAPGAGSTFRVRWPKERTS